jgi:hypothetical protein
VTRFEYKFQLDIGSDPPDGDDHTEEALNRLGRDGWELVAVSQCGKGGTYLGFWFKRPISSK